MRKNLASLKKTAQSSSTTNESAKPSTRRKTRPLGNPRLAMSTTAASSTLDRSPSRRVAQTSKRRPSSASDHFHSCSSDVSPRFGASSPAQGKLQGPSGRLSFFPNKSEVIGRPRKSMDIIGSPVAIPSKITDREQLAKVKNRWLEISRLTQSSSTQLPPPPRTSVSEIPRVNSTQVSRPSSGRLSANTSHLPSPKSFTRTGIPSLPPLVQISREEVSISPLSRQHAADNNDSDEEDLLSYRPATQPSGDRFGSAFLSRSLILPAPKSPRTERLTTNNEGRGRPSFASSVLAASAFDFRPLAEKDRQLSSTPSQPTINDISDEPAQVPKPFPTTPVRVIRHPKADGSSLLLEESPNYGQKRLDKEESDTESVYTCPSDDEENETPPPTPSKPTAKQGKLTTKNRSDIAQRWYRTFNAEVFNGKLPPALEIKWNARTQKTAGLTRFLIGDTELSSHVECPGGRTNCAEPKEVREVKCIELSTKWITSEDRLARTLLHECCHVAQLLLESARDKPHGPLFRKWAAKATEVFPNYAVGVRHQYDMDGPHHKWECDICRKTYARWTKSLDTSKYACGVKGCKGHLVYLGKFNAQGLIGKRTPAASGSAGGSGTEAAAGSKKKLNAFQLFVKENYSVVQLATGLKHQEVMKELGRMWRELQ